MRRRWLVVLVVAVAGAAALTAFAFLSPAVREDSSATEPAVRPATTAEVQAAFAAGLDALRRGDEQAWRDALPVRGQASREARVELYRTLSPLPWTKLSASVEPVPDEPGRFTVRILGEIAGVGPADRLVAERVFDVERRRATALTVITGDATPKDLAARYLMAFDRPAATSGQGCVVIADPDWAATARQLAAAAAVGRARLSEIGLAPERPVMIFLFRDEAQLRVSLGDAPEQRIKYFSAPVDRYPPTAWWPRDVGVLGPAIQGQQAWMPHMLGHELTHAFTFRWFARTRNSPLFILEGLATMVEGGRSYQHLRDEIATGNRTMPLLATMELHNFWSDHSIDEVHLAYYEAGSVVSYVLSAWGLPALRDFSVAVADSDMTDAGIKAAVEQTLHVSWPEFVSGWEAYVQTLP